MEMLTLLSVYYQSTCQCFSIQLELKRSVVDRVKGKCLRSCKNIRVCKWPRLGHEGSFESKHLQLCSSQREQVVRIHLGYSP